MKQGRGPGGAAEFTGGAPMVVVVVGCGEGRGGGGGWGRGKGGVVREAKFPDRK